MRISVIVAVHNGSRTLEACLAAIQASERRADEIIVVDDASTDSVRTIAEAHGARVIRLEGAAHGPALARNRGAEAASGDLLFFVDADVALHPDALALAERALSEDPQLAACFGSYDDHPSAPGLVSQFRNILHHYVHQHANEQADSFWAGCGCIRRQALMDAGGFLEAYGRPSVEDVDLGARLRAAGLRIRLLKDMQGTHLKRWTLWGMLVTDIRDRAAPWTRVIIRQGKLPNDLNLRTESRWSGVCALAMAATMALGMLRPTAWLALLPLMAALVALNYPLYRLFVRAHGWGFALGATLLHWLYYLYSTLTFGLIVGHRWLARRGLALLLLATLIKGLAWSVVVPLWKAPDERFHFLYGQQIERFGTVLITPNDLVPQEAVELWRLIDDPKLSRKGASPAALRAAEETLAWLNSAAAKHIYTDGHGLGFGSGQFYAYHPPLYYVLIAAVQWPLEGLDLGTRIWACRLLSVLLGVATAWLAYASGLELWPGRRGRALLLGVLVSFHPHVTYLSSTVTNMALEITLFSAATLLVLRLVERGMTWRLGLALGLVTAAGLLTKVSFVGIAPLLGVVLIWQIVQMRRRRGAWRSLWPWLMVAGLPALLAGWWYVRSLGGGGAGLLTGYGALGTPLRVKPLAFLLHYDWEKRYREVMLAYWNLGPTALLRLLFGSFVVALWGLAWHLLRVWLRHGRAAWPALARWLLLGVPTLGVVALYTYLDYRMMRFTGGYYILQGRYYLTPVVSQMACYAIGLLASAPRRVRPLWAVLVGAAMLGLNVYMLLRVLVTRFYGAGLLGALQRAARLHPVGNAPRFVLCGLFLLVTAALGLALWHRQDWLEDLSG